MPLGDTLEQHAPTVGRFAWAMAWVGLVVGQLHALSRHRTEDGKEDLELSTTAVWAEPAGEALSPLLEWGDPDLVYVTYGKIWLPVFLAFFLCAVLVRHRRQPQGSEKWVWRVVLVGYGWAVLGVTLDYWTQWTGEYNALFEVAFALTLPAVLITVIGSTVLGITLLVKGYRPWLPAVLLALTFPLALVITMVTSMGNVALPIAFAFGLLGRRLAADEASPAEVPSAPAPVGR
jgi:hypothetical protein